LVYPLLYILSLPYQAGVRIRNFLYGRRVLKVHPIAVPVIAVGNITVGGTGKTPLVAFLAAEAIRRGFRPGVVARGYRAEEREGERINDEGLLLRESVPGLIVVQHPDRVLAARRALDEHGVDLIILDDGFQHRRIGRDLDIVTIDGEDPFGNERLLPAGLLREPLAGIGRADAIVITRCDACSKEALTDLEARLGSLTNAALFRALHRPDRLVRIDDGEQHSLDLLAGKQVFLCCGIANPAAFQKTAVSLGARVVGLRAFSDHHHYCREDVVAVKSDAAEVGAELVMTTGKDAVKLRAFPEAGEFVVLHVSVAMCEGEADFPGFVFDRFDTKGRTERRD
jgi:tetraacyldisaccharide 4'-kinase